MSPKRGWTAPFLHRRDATSSLALQLCEAGDAVAGCFLEAQSLVVWFLNIGIHFFPKTFLQFSGVLLFVLGVVSRR